MDENTASHQLSNVLFSEQAMHISILAMFLFHHCAAYSTAVTTTPPPHVDMFLRGEGLEEDISKKEVCKEAHGDSGLMVSSGPLSPL